VAWITDRLNEDAKTAYGYFDGCWPNRFAILAEAA